MQLLKSRRDRLGHFPSVKFTQECVVRKCCPEASKRCSSYCFSDHQAYPHFPSFAVATLAPSKRSHCFQNFVAYLSLRSRLCSSIPYLSNPKLHSCKTSTLIHFQFSCDPQNYQNVGGKDHLHTLVLNYGMAFLKTSENVYLLILSKLISKHSFSSLDRFSCLHAPWALHRVDLARYKLHYYYYYY